nr:1-acyl-sn-glycerol-3-phosphate acyltransferase alpha-like [Anolis sagrei ordinatus]
MMEVSQMEGLLLLLSLLGFPFLYLRSITIKYYCKVGFLFFLVGFACFWTVILCAYKGRNMDNARIFSKLLVLIKYFFGIRFKIQGLENLPDEDCYVMVANHQGYLDFIALSEFLPPQCVTLTKKEFRFVGLLGLTFWLCGFFFIDREEKSRAINTMLYIQKAMVAKRFRVLIFPEGTRNHNTSMLPFKHGAFHLAIQAQVPVVPVVISSYHHFCSTIQKTFTKGECTIQILPTVETQGLKADDVLELTKLVRDSMLKVFYQISEEVKQ